MPDVSNIYGQNYESWEELFPSTRTSLATWPKQFPINTTLAVPGTAQNLWAAPTTRPTVNLATNPSFETGNPPTGYTLVGSAISQSAVIARNGTNSILANPNNAAAGEGFYWTSPIVLGGKTDASNFDYLIVSAYFNDNAGSGDGARIIIADSNGVTLANGNTLALSAAWQRSIAAFALTQTGATYRAYFVTSAQHNTNFYVDSFLAEVRRGDSSASDYVDGAVGLDYEWMGTAHASRSRRRPQMIVIRGFDLHFTRDTYVAFDRTASTTDGGSVFIRAGTDWSPQHPIHADRQLSYINSVAGESPGVWGTLWGVAVGKVN